jgi:hypothetical protein
MSEDPAKPAEIVEEHSTFLLIRAGPCFAVIERRNGRLYPMAPGEREGVAITPEGMAALMAEEGSLAEGEARHLFAELCDRGDRLAQSLR